MKTSLNNLAVAVVDSEWLSLDARDKMFYKTFKDEKEVYNDIKALNTSLLSHPSDFDNLHISFHSINTFFTSLNEDLIDVENCYAIPVFLEKAKYTLPKALDEKLSSDEENKGFTAAFEKVYQQGYDETLDLLSKVGEVNFMGNTYYAVGNEIKFRDNSTNEIHTSLGTYYEMCEVFDGIKTSAANKTSLDTIIDKVLDLPCHKITDLMHYIQAWNEDERIEIFSSFNLGEFITTMNDKGYDVELNVRVGYDYYVYGHKTDNKTYEIYGLTNLREEFIDVLNLNENAKLIAENKDYLSYLDELVENKKSN